MDILIHVVYIGIVFVLLGAFVWQRIRAGFWKRLYKQSVEFKGAIEGFRHGAAHTDTNQWPELIERKEQ